MGDRMLRSLCDPVVYWGPPVDDGHGERQWPMPLECVARFFPAFKWGEERDSEDVQAAETVLVDAEPLKQLPENGGYLWRGLLVDLLDVRPPFDANNETIAREIVGVHHLRGIRQRPRLLAAVKVR